MKFFVLLTTLIVARNLYGKELNLDPDKFTICAITINSDNERKVFESQVKKFPKKFNPIVELTDFGDSDWFDKACASGIRCDELIISGHFGGTFFGSSGKTLPINALEEKGCSKTCEGILSHPYEVFLFGCNTLSTKEKDHRTPEEYLQILINDGISRRDAEMVVESRYGNLGDDHKSMMQRAFSGQKKQLYGFYSVGPSGKNVEGFLKKYFKKNTLLDQLEKLSVKRVVEQVDKGNETLAEALKSTNFTQCPSGGDFADEKTRIICGLLDEKSSLDSKLELMIDALSSENYLTYIPAINNLLKKHDISKMNSGQLATIKEIKSNNVIKNQIINLVKNTKSLTLLSEWIRFAKNFDYISKLEESKIISQRILEAVKKPLSLEDKDIICSLPQDLIKNVDIKVENLGERSLKSNDIHALNCIGIKDEKVIFKIAESISSKDMQTQLSVATVLSEYKFKDEKINELLASELKNSPRTLKASILEVFNRSHPEGEKSQLAIVECLTEVDYKPNHYRGGLDDATPGTDEAMMFMSELMREEGQGSVADQAERILMDLKPKNQKVLARIKALNPSLYKKLKN